MIYYNLQDAQNTLHLHKNLYNMNIKSQISKIYEKIDFCDDIQHRDNLVKKIHRLKSKLLK